MSEIENDLLQKLEFLMNDNKIIFDSIDVLLRFAKNRLFTIFPHK